MMGLGTLVYELMDRGLNGVCIKMELHRRGCLLGWFT